MKDSIFALDHIMYGIFMIIVLNIAGLLMLFADIMPHQIDMVISIGFPVFLVLFAFLHGLKNNIGFKSYIVISLILWLILSLLNQRGALFFASAGPVMAIRNLDKYIFKRVIDEYYEGQIGYLFVNTVVLAIMYLSYQGGYIVSKRLKNKDNNI